MNTQFIAVIEDNPADLQLCKLAFSDLGMNERLIHFPDGESFLDFLDQHGADSLEFILLDLNMPGMTGFDILSHVRSLPSYSELPVIVFTTSSNISHVRTCYDLGANAYVVKPLNYTDYFGTVQSVTRFWADTDKVLANITAR